MFLKKQVSGCSSAVGKVRYKWVTIMDDVKCEFNDIFKL